MKAYTQTELKDEFRKHSYLWPDFHLIGIRSKADLPNQFDDHFYLVNRIEYTHYTGTTNPGTHWLTNLLNSKGAALLKPGQYFNTWQLGLHRGLYEALVQVRPVKVWRDANKNQHSEPGTEVYEGMFGINIHRASANQVSKFIDKWSAGCQVLNNPQDFAHLINSFKATGKKYLPAYTLLNEF